MRPGWGRNLRFAFVRRATSVWRYIERCLEPKHAAKCSRGGGGEPALVADPALMRVGLTGGMGCGKSTVGRIFADLGWQRIDADEIVRRLLQEDADVIRAVRAALGPGVMDGRGALDRRRIATLVFEDSGALQRLEDILHPRVRATWQAAVAEPGAGNWVVEIPLLFEKGLEKEFDFTVCVASDPHVQAERLASRGLSPQEASRRMARQLPLVQKIERADFVITNNGSLAFLRDQVTRLVEHLTKPTA